MPMLRLPACRTVAALLASACLASALGAEVKDVPIGTPIKQLTFKDIRYLRRNLDDLPRSKAYVLAVVNTTCPLARRYLPALNRLEKEYRSKSVQFVGINAGGDDSIRAMAVQAVEHDVEYPFVRDFEARCAAAVGVKRTPQVVVLDG